ncbi:MAG: hypothetical protein LBD73_03835, partial [Deferribacteraceae bacterium]|nr:hypothetical protein [Deferribacteraceae bacterium]
MKDFLSSLAETTKRLNFGIIVHNRTDSTTFSIKKGEVSGSELPESISGHIFDVNCHCAYFSHGEKVVVIYFVRFILKKQHLVVIIQDTKQRLRVNKFISALINSLYGNRADTNLTEEFLENFDIERRGYEQRIQKLTEDALFDKALWQREKDELSAVVAELKSDIENYKLSKLWDKASEEEIASLREGAAKLKGIELKYENLVRDMWVIKNDLEDARRENLALSGELSAEKACKEAGSGEEKESAIRAGLEALKNENTALRREIREYSEIIAKKDALLEELNRRQNMGDVKENSNETQPINTDSESETDRLRRELEKQFLRCSELEKLNEKVTGDFSRRGDILEECRKELSET